MADIPKNGPVESHGVHSGADELVALLAPLNDPLLPAAQHAAIAEHIKRTIVDLDQLARCDALPAGHPLRVAAAALWTAFEAVTSGPVAEEALALHEVSRQSPLGPWKMLIRAIAAWYRRDDALCRKYVAAVDPGSAPARLLPALHMLTGEKRTPTPAERELVKRAAGDTASLKFAFEQLDRAFHIRKQAQILPGVRTAVQLCRQLDPALVERLMQHIGIRGAALGLNPGSVGTAMQGSSRKNAHFWRLLARSHEEEKPSPFVIPAACSAWEEFRKHAIREGWFPDRGPEAAALYLHIAELWERIPPEYLRYGKAGYMPVVERIQQYYKNQPPEIQALRPHPQKPDLYYLDPREALRRACEADPCSENFHRWLSITGQKGEFADSVAEVWARVLPNDIPPLLHLMQSAERRDALKKAFKYMRRAEEIDGLNTEVRRARLRLLVSMTIRHLKTRKPVLAEDDLRQLEALPQAQQGDRPAFVSALRWVQAALGGCEQGSGDPRGAIVRQLQSEIAANLLLGAVAAVCGMVFPEDRRSLKKMPVSAAAGRVCALLEDMGVPVRIPESVWARVHEEVKDTRFRAPAVALVALGDAALDEELPQLAYGISGAGLSQGPDCQARLLFLRARAMPPWEPEREAECHAAAAELARRQRDSELLKRIGQWRDEETAWFDVPADGAVTSLNSEQLNQIVKRESQYGYPPPPNRAQQEAMSPFPFEDLPDMSDLAGMMEELGPDAVVRALAEVLGEDNGGGRRKSRRRRLEITDDDVPF